MNKLVALTIAAAALSASAVPATADHGREPTAEARAPKVVVSGADLLIRVPKSAALACIKNKTNTWTRGKGDCEPMRRTKGGYEAEWRGRKMAVGRKVVVLIIGGVYRDGRKYTVRVGADES